MQKRTKESIVLLILYSLLRFAGAVAHSDWSREQRDIHKRSVTKKGSVTRVSAVTVAVCVPNPRMRKENPEEDPKSRSIPKSRRIPKRTRRAEEEPRYPEDPRRISSLIINEVSDSLDPRKSAGRNRT